VGDIITLAQVAKESGVSISTVSRLLNPTHPGGKIGKRSAQRVRDAAMRLGYVPNYHAQVMKKGSSGVVGVVLDLAREVDTDPEATALGMPYFGTMVGAIERRTRELGVDMAIVATTDQARAVERGLLGVKQRKYDGLLVWTSSERDLQFLIDNPMPVPVVLLGLAPRGELPLVYWDEPAAVQMAVEHLSSLGHRELLWIGPDGPCERERLFMKAVWDGGLRGASCRYEKIDTECLGRIAELVEAAVHKHLAAQPRTFTGVVCYNDTVAAAACAACLDSGLKIPADLSVVGFDNVLAAVCYPHLTSVSQRLYELGRRATDLLIEMTQHENDWSKYRGLRETIAPRLVPRKSTGPIPSNSTSPSKG